MSREAQLPLLLLTLWSLLAAPGPASAQATAAQRQVQICTVDLGFSGSFVELHNFGAGDVPLTGWRFCTHDDDEAFRYSGVAGLSGVTIEAGTSIRIHYDGNAPPGPDDFDVADLGGSFATPLDADAYGLALYVNAGFDDGVNLADYVQWSFGGVADATADERADEAVAGGVWTAESEWVATAANADRIRLLPASEGAVLHGPADYDVHLVPPVPALSGAGRAVAWLALAGLGRAGLRRERTRAAAPPAGLR